MHKLTLKQEGENLSGSHEGLIYGPYPWIDSGVLDRIPPADGGELKASFSGTFFKTSSSHNLFYLHRKNLSDRRGKDGPFEAIFTATLSADGQTAIGQLVNSGGQYGTMLMVRRKALSRYKHLLESDTAGKTELAGTKKPGEAGVDDIPQGVEALEAALNEERMAQAVEMFEKLDKNKDGKITDKEGPPAQFQKPVWIRANINGDMILSWEEELIWQYNTQKKAAQADDKAKAKARAKKRPPNPAMQPIEDVPGLPRVLLIGDSISIGYTVGVREELKGKANVHRVLTNCGPTIKGIDLIDNWLGEKKWDVIHFNSGLHDLKYMGPKGQNLADPKDATGRQQVPIDEYEKHLQTLVARMKKTGAQMIWCSTTPVPEGARGRVVGDSVKYNAVAAQVMQTNDVAIDDLYAFAQPQLTKIQKKADVHFSPAGSKILAAQVANSINAALDGN